MADPPYTETAAVPPRTPDEEAVAAIWRDVLRRPEIGVLDDFFEVGGHSLLAVQVVVRIRKTLGVDIPVMDLFESPTVSALAAAVAKAHGTSPARPEVTRRPPGAEPVLSFDQQRLWLENQLRPGAAYNVHGRRRLVGELDVAALERSIRAILVRHEALRTRFPVVDGRPVQVVDDVGEQWRISLEDLSGAGADRDSVAARLADQHASASFDLAHGPLFTCLLIKLSDTEHLLSITMHHIVSDAWSVGLFLMELSGLYRAGGDVRAANLPSLPVQYQDYAVWQRRWLAGETLEAQLGYWRGQMAAAPPALALPTARRRSASQGVIGGRLRSGLSAEETAALRDLCRKHGVTLFMALLAALATVLRRWSGQDDVVIGAPITTRSDAGTGQLIGFFVNTLPLRVDLSGDPAFAELLARVRKVALDGYAHGEAPFDVLVQELQAPRDPTRTPLFQVVLNMVDIEDENPRIAGISVEDAETPVLPSKFDLILNARESGGAVHFELAFHDDRYDAGTIGVLLHHFAALLSAVADDPGRCILDYPLPDPDVAGTAAAQAYRPAPAPHLAVERYALRLPDRVAVTDIAGQWTYRQLSLAADRVAHMLAGRGPEATGQVGVVRRRAAGFVAAVLGCIKAGAPFSVVEGRAPGSARLPGIGTVLDPDDILAQVSGPQAPLARDPGQPGQDADWAAERFDLTGEDRFAVLSGSSAHLMSALCTALFAGATLHIPDSAATSDAGALVEWLGANAVSVVYLSPPLLRALAAQDPAPLLPLIRYAFIDNGGDLTCQDVSALNRISASCRCVSTYRVTQTGQPLAVFEVPGRWCQEAAPLRVPLGTAVNGVQLLNPAGRPAAVGEVGEICFAAERTGDLGRRTRDGTLELAATTTDPVETLVTLRDLHGVSDAITTEYYDIDGRATLTAYVASQDPELSSAALRRHLLTSLPEYLVPEQLVLLDRLPLTQDGDYDLAALPDPDCDGEPDDMYVAPRTPMERQLTEIFQELLGADRLGVHDTFFEQDGFSLLATQLASRVRDTFKCELSLREVFESPTVEGLAQLIVRMQAELADGADLDALLAEIG